MTPVTKTENSALSGMDPQILETRFAETIREVNEEIVKKYIRDQKRIHGQIMQGGRSYGF